MPHLMLSGLAQCSPWANCSSKHVFQKWSSGGYTRISYIILHIFKKKKSLTFPWKKLSSYCAQPFCDLGKGSQDWSTRFSLLSFALLPFTYSKFQGNVRDGGSTLVWSHSLDCSLYHKYPDTQRKNLSFCECPADPLKAVFQRNTSAQLFLHSAELFSLSLSSRALFLPIPWPPHRCLL